MPDTSTAPIALITKARQQFHAALLTKVLAAEDGVPSNADKDSRLSIRVARGIAEKIGMSAATDRARLAGQTSGSDFEEITAAYLRETFLYLRHIRPGMWDVIRAATKKQKKRAAKGIDVGESGFRISNYEQYTHLRALARIAETDRELAAALRSDYAIKPDVVITRTPETDAALNALRPIVDASSANYASIRLENNTTPLLHAVISCKWTIRSDRVQNARSEALNLMRNRKGRVPHMVVVTGEPMPSRLAAIALGTGDIDCVYHFALAELLATLGELQHEDAREMAAIMVEGKRLRDIGDLPLDLAT